jgi:hypothetical protein
VIPQPSCAGSIGLRDVLAQYESIIPSGKPTVAVTTVHTGRRCLVGML